MCTLFILSLLVGGLRMSRHGKLSGSPFQVESIFYKYAIENECNDCQLKKEIPQCPHYKLKNNSCGLFNSGYQACAAHKCRFLRLEQRRNNTCHQCAYFYDGYCAHKKGQKTTNPSIASYCCFFNNEPVTVKRVRNDILISVLKNEIETCNITIKRSKKYIKEAQKELTSNKVSESDRKYLENKIIVRYNRIFEFEKKLSVLRQKLANAEKQRKNST